MMTAGGDSACTRADLQLVRALGRGLCSAVALATWWTHTLGKLHRACRAVVLAVALH